MSCVIPVSTRVLHHNVMVFVNAAHGACGGEGLEHAVSPSTVTVLKRLHYFQVQVNVDQVPNLKTTWVSVAILLTCSNSNSLQYDLTHRTVKCHALILLV